VIALVRIVTQLERLGDLAVNLAERAGSLAALPPLPPFEDLACMAARVQGMVKLAFVALAARDTAAAEKVLAMDDEVDRLHRGAFRHYEELMRADPTHVERAVLMLSCSRQLERAGDHAKKIAADAIWIVDGRVVRHGSGHAELDQILISA
jgi:phosphate transport system protein